MNEHENRIGKRETLLPEGETMVASPDSEQKRAITDLLRQKLGHLKLPQ